ncbi:KAP family P-loop domain protein [soil metagenome]
MPDWSAALFDDNPAKVDLLSLSPVASAIAGTVTNPRLNPVAVGINSPWGGGKSTALLLVEGELRKTPTVLVVKVDPWEFVDSGDPRGTLIARVLDGLETSYATRVKQLEEERELHERASATLAALGAKLNSLRRRISWSKVAQVALKSAITMTPDLGALVDALTPGPEQINAKPETAGMKDFRREFEGIVSQLPAVERVVVLVDDLDRCLPNDVLGAFEAIKLFLSVEGMAFVIAADEAFIRESLRAALARHGRGRFADRYTEKVIQLPFTLPLLTPADAEAYVALLYTAEEAEERDMEEIVREAAARRSLGNAPYVTASMSGEFPRIEVITRAASMLHGMASETSSTPRQLKRFLNNFAVRASLLTATRHLVQEDVVMKMWILEQNFADSFNRLARLASNERTDLLRLWEGAADDVDPLLAKWANDGATLSDAPDEVTAYLSLAASVLTNAVLGGHLGSEDALVLAGLLSDDQIARRAAQAQLEISQPNEGDIIHHLAAAVGGAHRDNALESLQQVGARRPDLVDVATPILLRPDLLRTIEITDLVWLSGYRDVLEALQALHADNAEFVDAVRDEIDGTI